MKNIRKKSRQKKIIIVVGARPDFIKAAPIYTELRKHKQSKLIFVHTGQHYDVEMSRAILHDLKLPTPDVYLGVGSGTHSLQTAAIMLAFEKVCVNEKPDLVIVVGDVNSTLACALAAAKIKIPIAHVEAGLRSFDRSMPDEINRLLTDQISDFLFTTCEDADQNLINEGIPKDKIFFVGNVIIDSLTSNLKSAQKSNILERLGLENNKVIKKYAVLTLHRPSNVDKQDVFEGILKSLDVVTKRIPIIYPAHPRAMRQIETFHLEYLVDNVDYRDKKIDSGDNIRKVRVVPPLGYLDFLCLMANAAFIITDSGGIQDETTILGIPCLTIRENTERPITITQGTNTLVGVSPDRILQAAGRTLAKRKNKKKTPKFWDGKASQRIINILLDRL